MTTNDTTRDDAIRAELDKFIRHDSNHVALIRADYHGTVIYVGERDGRYDVIRAFGIGPNAGASVDRQSATANEVIEYLADRLEQARARN